MVGRPEKGTQQTPGDGSPNHPCRTGDSGSCEGPDREECADRRAEDHSSCGSEKDTPHSRRSPSDRTANGSFACLIPGFPEVVHIDHLLCLLVFAHRLLAPDHTKGVSLYAETNELVDCGLRLVSVGEDPDHSWHGANVPDTSGDQSLPVSFGEMTERDTTTLRRPEPKTSHGDGDAVAHIVMKDDQMRGYVTGEPIKALCGKTWIPSRDYQGLPVCQACVEERDRIISGMKNLN